MAQNQSSPIPAQACNGIPAVAPPGAHTCRTRQWSPHCSHPDKQTPWLPSLHNWEGSPDSPGLRHHPPSPLPPLLAPSTALRGPVEPVLRRAWSRLQGAVPCFCLLSLCAQKGTLEAVGGCRVDQWVVSVEMSPGGHGPASPAPLQSCVPRTNSLSHEGNAKVSTK